MKKKIQKIDRISDAEMYVAMQQYAEIDTQLEKLNARIDAEVAKVRAKYANEIETLEAKRQHEFEVVERYADQHRDTLFQLKRSHVTVHGTFGYRLGRPSLVLTNPMVKWDKGVLEHMRNFAPQYIRTVEEVDKTRLIADREKPEVQALMQAAHVRVEQSETFYIKKS